MKREEFEAMGERHKAFEAPWTMQKLKAGKPIVVRLDGRSFHTFTIGLERPHDENLRRAFIETTKYLIGETQADMGYCQSDEITLAWANNDPLKEMLFDGRVQKLCSVLASMASVKFNHEIQMRLPAKADLMPVFDARVYQYPTLEDASEVFTWREADATRNSLTMAAHAHYDNKTLHKAGFKKKHELLNAKGIEWSDYPTSFKRGVYVRRGKMLKHLSPEEMSRIPEKHRPTEPVLRSVVVEMDMPPVATLKNAVECLFFGYSPIVGKT